MEHWAPTRRTTGLRMALAFGALLGFGATTVDVSSAGRDEKVVVNTQYYEGLIATLDGSRTTKAPDAWRRIVVSCRESGDTRDPVVFSAI